MAHLLEQSRSESKRSKLLIWRMVFAEKTAVFRHHAIGRRSSLPSKGLTKVEGARLARFL
jgi:hypothetical protein